MDQIISNLETLSDYNSKDKCEMIESDQQNFETEIYLVFQKPNLIKDDDEVEEKEMIEKLYFIQNNKSNFIPSIEKDVNIKDVSKNIKKEIFDPIQQEKKTSTISLDEDAEEEKEKESISYPTDTIKTNNIWSDNSLLQSGETNLQKSSTTENNIRTNIKKPNPFQVYKSTEINIFHPGGKVELFKKIKNEIQDIDKMYETKPSLICKFKVKKKSKKINRRKRKEKILRKCKPDNIRKKIKSRFFKAIKTRINQILKNAKSKELFDLLPQCFIINITKKKNKPIMKMSFKNLLEYDFISEELNEEKHETEFLRKKRSVDIKKYNKNLRVIDYLNKNGEILKRSKFDIIGNMTVAQMFAEYLKSDELEKEVVKLQEEGDDLNYIKDYIVKAFGFINYFN